jgi:hypothetical protein
MEIARNKDTYVVVWVCELCNGKSRDSCLLCWRLVGPTRKSQTVDHSLSAVSHWLIYAFAYSLQMCEINKRKNLKRPVFVFELYLKDSFEIKMAPSNWSPSTNM